jgi:hypothetical protein
MYHKVLISAISLVLAAQANAQSYQFEGSANYSHDKGNKPFTSKGDQASFYGSYYFSPVTTDNHPLEEAAFLEKNSSVSLAYLNGKSTESNTYDGGFFRAKYDSESKNSVVLVSASTYLLDGLVYIGGVVSYFDTKNTNTTVVASDTFSDLNYTETTKGTESDDDWRINLGMAPVTGLLIWSEFQKDIDVDKSWNLNAKYVLEFNGSALNIQGGLGKNAYAFLSTSFAVDTNSVKLNFVGIEGEDDEGLNSVYLIGDYYFNNTLSLGLGVSDYNGDSDSGFENTDNSYLIRSKYFITETFSIQAEYLQEDFQDTFSIGAAMRF